MDKTKPENWNGAPIPYGLPVDELERRLAQADSTAWAACAALAHAPGRPALDVLCRAARAPDWSLRRAAVEAISNHALAQDVSELLHIALHDISPFVARTACEAVARLRMMVAHDDVLGLTSAEEAATRVEAVRSIAALWQMTDFSPVLNLYQYDPSDEVRREAAWTLRRNVNITTWKRLFDLWKDDGLPRHRLWAVQLAGEFGQGSVKAELEEIADDVDGHVRKAVLSALQPAAI